MMESTAGRASADEFDQRQQELPVGPGELFNSGGRLGIRLRDLVRFLQGGRCPFGIYVWRLDSIEPGATAVSTFN